MPTTPTPTRQRIRNRLAMSMALFVMLCALSTVATVAIVAGTISTLSDRTQTTLALVETETSLRLSITAQRALAMDYGLSRSPRTLDAFGDAQEAELHAYVEFARLAPDDEELSAALARVRTLFGSWRENWAEPYVNDVSSGIAVSGGVAVVQSESAFRPVVGAIDSLTELIAERQATAEAVLAGAVRQLVGVLVPIGLGAVLLSAILGIWLTRTISGPLQRLNRTANALVAGEEVTFNAEKDDEIGALARLLEQMRGDSARRYQAARVEAETAATFNQLSELTSFAQTEETLVDVAARVLGRVAPSMRGHVMLLNNSTNRLTVAASWGDDARAVGSVAELERIDRCPGIRRAAAYVADDVSDALAVRCPAHVAESGTVVCLPMPALGSIVGVIHLERNEPNGFDGSTVNRAARIAEQVALAIANSRLMATMEGLANTDPLTSLRNARYFETHLEQALEAGERSGASVGLIMLDVDHFKDFNDTYGHPAGDEALRALSRTLRGVVRERDVVARYGGEEFIVTLHDTGLEGARVVAEKMRLAVEQNAFEIGPGRFARITVSLGVAATDVHAVDLKGLVALADAALYRAKEGGRNRVETPPTGAAELERAARRRRADLPAADAARETRVAVAEAPAAGPTEAAAPSAKAGQNGRGARRSAQDRLDAG